MKKKLLILIFFAIIFNFSFAEGMKIIDGVKYVPKDFVEKFWGTDVTYYENSQLVKIVINPDTYYFQVNSETVKKNAYINPFFINSKGIKLTSKDKIDGKVVLEDGQIYFPISFFHQKMYAENEYDIIVVGGDPEGITAAVSAARNGAKVLLLSSEDGLGGLFTFGMLNSLDMNYSKDGELLTKGIFQEFYDKIDRKDSFDVEEVKKIFEDMVSNEKNIDCRKSYKFKEPILDGKIIKGVKTLNKDEIEETFYAKRVIDATQDGDVCAASGVPYYEGMQDINVDENMAATLVFKVCGVQWEELIKDLERYKIETGDNNCGWNSSSMWGFGKWCYDNYTPINSNMRLRGPNFGLQNDGSILLNALQIFDVNIEDTESIAKAKYDGTQEAYNIVSYLKKKLNSFSKAYLMNVANELYIRETRHIQGEYVLQAGDLLNGTNFEDKIALGSYPVDIQSTGVDNYGYVLFAPDKYAIPLRCTVPLSIDNLFIIGKSASYSSVAAGSTRVVPVGMVVGESIGAISMYSIVNNVMPREIIKNYEMTSEISQLLVNQGVYLPEINSVTSIKEIEGHEKIEKLIDLGIVVGGYNNDFKLDSFTTCATAYNVLSGAVKRNNKVLPTDYNLDELSMYCNLNTKLDAITMSKMILKFIGIQDFPSSDTLIWYFACEGGYFKGAKGMDMYDVMTVKDLYNVIYNVINKIDVAEGNHE